MRLPTAIIGCLVALAVLPAVTYGQASAAQYGGVEQEIATGTTPTPGAPPTDGPGQDTAPDTGSGGSPQPGSAVGPEEDAAAAPEGTLPFTGQDLVLLLLAGLGLAGLGFALRRAAHAPAA